MWEAIIAACAAIFGGVGLKLIESIVNRGRNNSDIATQIRTELRQDIKRLKDQVEELQEGRDTAKQDFYDMQQRHAELNVIVTGALALLAKAVREHSTNGRMSNSTKQEMRKFLDKHSPL